MKKTINTIDFTAKEVDKYEIKMLEVECCIKTSITVCNFRLYVTPEAWEDDRFILGELKHACKEVGMILYPIKKKP